MLDELGRHEVGELCPPAKPSLVLQKDAAARQLSVDDRGRLAGVEEVESPGYVQADIDHLGNTTTQVLLLCADCWLRKAIKKKLIF